MSARRPRAQLVPRRRLRCRGRRRAPIVGIGAAAAHCQIEAVRAEGSRPSQNALAPRATLRAPNTRCIGTGLRAARAATRSAARAHCTAGRSGHRFQNGREALRKVIRERSARECRAEAEALLAVAGTGAVLEAAVDSVDVVLEGSAVATGETHEKTTAVASPAV
eukprot:2297896-Prymnesium_polylepis.2